MASEPISKLLGESAELQPLAERLRQVQRLQKRYRTLVPESLAQASRVCAIDGAIVVICAASGPVASALRHLAPRLLEGLRTVRRSPKHPRDQELTSIRIEVQADRPVPPRPVKGRGEMPREKLAGVAGKLADSPLKETLERIGKAPHSRITRSKT